MNSLIETCRQYKVLDLLLFIVICMVFYGFVLYQHYHHIKNDPISSKLIENFDGNPLDSGSDSDSDSDPIPQDNLLDKHRKGINDAFYDTYDHIKDSVGYLFGKKGYVSDSEDIYEDDDDEEGDGFEEYCDDSPYPIWFLKGVGEVKKVLPFFKDRFVFTDIQSVQSV